MKIITKTLLLTIILIFFPFKSFAHVEHYEKVEKFLMEIFKEGKKILDASGLKILSADNLNDAAKKIVKAIK